LFDVRVISTELLSGCLWIVTLFKTILSDNSNDQIVSGIMLVLFTVFGVFLVRSVYREVAQREKIENLAKDLSKANDRLKGLDQLKSEFVSLASHQIRGPLAAIKGYASEIIEGDFGEVPNNLKNPIKTIFQSCESLVVIVEDFLNVSRIEQGGMKYDATDFSMGGLVTEVLNEVEPTLSSKHLKLVTDLDNSIIVKADRGKIKQILNNLVDNSIKYTHSGTLTVRVTKSGSGSNMLFSIKDTGIGIGPKTMPKLFQKFSRAEDASKANIMGTGLGLYVASEMIRAQGGSIWAESEGEGKGSTFFVELKAKN
jgi:signal transduction histidine kinase